MAVFLLFIFLSGNFIFGVIEKKDYIIKYFLIILLWILIWGNYSNADYINYLNSYNRNAEFIIGSNTSEIIWCYLMKFSNLINLNYNQFLLIISFISFYMLIKTTNKYTNNLNLFFVLYTIYPFFLNAVQIRFFFASSLAILILRIPDKKYYFIMSMTLLLIASFIHYSFFLLFPYMFLRKIKENKYKKIIFVSTIFLFCLFALDFHITLLKKVSFGPISNIYFKVKPYLSFKPSFLGFTLMVLIHFMLFFIFYVTYNEIKDSANGKLLDVFYKINVYSFILIPFYYINGNFMRMLQFFVIINYIFFAFSYKYIPKNKKIIYIFLFLSFPVIEFFRNIYLDNLQSVFYAILNNNYIFD